ncbi:MAG TPA: proton-conducting transporter membrane subunit, partial [Paracoccaceae bacterium]
KVALLPEGEAALIRVAGVLLILVFAVKGALVPLQFWLPATYAHAPGPVAALFAVMTKVGAYATLRLYTLVFPPDTPATGALFADLLLPAALVTLAVGSIGVIGASTLARLVAFATIASMGTLFTAIAQFTPAATAAALYYMIHSTLAGATMFLVADLVADRRAHDGLHRALPPIAQGGLIGGLFLAGAIAMAGMPPLSGFVGKLLVLDATRGAQMGLIWPTILITSLITILGFARAGSTLFWKAHASVGEVAEHRTEALSFAMVFVLLAGLAALTIFAGPVMDYTQATAAELFDRSGYIAANVLPGAQPGATP